MSYKTKTFIPLLLAVVLSVLVIVNFAESKEKAGKDSKAQAVEYRQKGFEAQERRNLDAAMNYYQQAIACDPRYAPAYNDIGVVYEMQGALDLAEENYLKAIEADPNYLAAYTNLASLYEKKAMPSKAADYWMKRVSLGVPGEYWTEKARDNFKSLGALSQDAREKFLKFEAENLSQEVNKKKLEDFQIAVIRSKEYYEQGQKLLKNGEYSSACSMFKAALLFNPNNKEIAQAYKEAKTQEISIKINEHASKGLRLYESGNLGAARDEFNSILTLIPGSSNQVKK